MDDNIKIYINAICDDLDILAPNILDLTELDVQELLTDTTLAMCAPDKWSIYIKSSVDGPDLYYAIAHELRHLWQFRNDIGMFKDYQNSNAGTIEDYNLQPAEIDANAYAFIVLRELLGIVPLWHGFSEKARIVTIKRMGEIEDE